eukprot:s4097_g9.t1
MAGPEHSTTGNHPCPRQGVEDAPALSAVVKHLWLLKPQGQHTLRRLLWVSQLTSNHVEFCPFLPNLMATLLSFFTEAETMFIVRQLLLEAENAPGGVLASEMAT